MPSSPFTSPSLPRIRPLARASVLALAATLLPGLASAQTALDTDPDPTTGTSPTGLTKDDFDIYLWASEGDEFVRFNTTLADTYFNRANCLCNVPLRVQVLLKTASINKVRTGTRADIRLRAGDQTCVCTGANCANLNCKDIGTPKDLASLVNGGLTFDTTVREIFSAGRPSTATGNVCDRDEMQNLWVWMDSDDAGADTELTDLSYAISLDGVPPASPAGLKVTPGNEALQVSWEELPYLDDLEGYIVFCSRGGEHPVFPGDFSPLYTPAGVCPADDQPSGGSSGTAPDKLAQLDPQFTCSDIIRSAGPVRLFQLQNGIPYVVGVASVDKSGNASPIENVVLQVPIPTRDFYRSYREEGGAAEGGFCAVAPGAGRRTPWLALAVLGPLAAIAIRRARRRR
jgi:hypothetical protein